MKRAGGGVTVPARSAVHLHGPALVPRTPNAGASRKAIEQGEAFGVRGIPALFRGLRVRLADVLLIVPD